MELNLTTPGLLFSAISLLLLAYTNRFLSLANLIRTLHGRYQQTGDKGAKAQIENLHKRVQLIKNMQLLGIGSLFLSVFCMVALFAGWVILGKILFGVSLILLLISLGMMMIEIQISVKALNIHLRDLD
ncbi:MAG: DUF2721 domain-containing protein [Balneolaceae bacterium]|nr:DUF2721 domain-containing protein [Balneolaceae bacterium]